MTKIFSAHLKNQILNTIKEYNKHRSKKSIAHLVAVNKNKFTIDFEGPFCTNCSVIECFREFTYDWRTNNKKIILDIGETKTIGLHTYRVQYYIRKNPFENDEEKLFQQFLKEMGLSFKEYLVSNSCTKDVVRFNFRTWLFEKRK